MVFRILKEVLIIALASGLGIAAYKWMNGFCRLLLAQLIAWDLIYIMSYAVTIYQKNKGLPEDNQWLFNLNVFIETSLLLLAASKWEGSRNFRKIALYALLLFTIVFVILILKSGFFTFNSYGYALESLFITLIYLLILKQSFYDFSDSNERKYERWICIGLILFFGCNLPYFSLFNFFNKYYPNLSKSLFFITESLANLRYLMLGISFWLFRQQAIKSARTAHE
jgi:hypothetical protein